MACAAGSAGEGGGTSTVNASPPRTLRALSLTATPAEQTCPSRSSACKRERDSSGSARASSWSTRCPACSAVAVTSSIAAPVDPSSNLIRALKVFVVAGGVVLVAGTVALIWLLATRGSVPVAGDGPGRIPVPSGFRAASIAYHDGTLVILGEDPQARQMVVITDPRKPEAARVLILEAR